MRDGVVECSSRVGSLSAEVQNAGAVEVYSDRVCVWCGCGRVAGALVLLLAAQCTVPRVGLSKTLYS
eukprot:scaffold7099_cov131-Isochrysis_galbana.AAC.20